MPRHLPVVQPEESEDALAASRPVWHWVLIGAGFTLTFWMPLSILVMRMSRFAPIGAFALAAGTAGALVGRFGGKTRPIHAAGSAVLAVAFAGLVVVLRSRGPDVLSFLLTGGAVLSVVGAPASFAGAHVGRSKRPGKTRPEPAKPRH